MELLKVTGAFVQFKTCAKRAFSGYDNDFSLASHDKDIFLGLASDIGIYIRSSFPMQYQRRFCPSVFQSVVFIGPLGVFLSALFLYILHQGSFLWLLPFLGVAKSGLIELWLEDD